MRESEVENPKALLSWSLFKVDGNLTIELDYPYYLVVKYGAAILHEIVSDENEGILGEQRCKEIAIVDFDGNFNSYQYLQLNELELMYNILHELEYIKFLGLTSQD